MRCRSVPQGIQQQAIRVYCERNNLVFKLSATEFFGRTIMLNSIRESVIVMYSMFQFQRGWKTDKEIHFAAENCKYGPDIDEIFEVIDLYERSGVSSTIAQIDPEKLFGANERQ